MHSLGGLQKKIKHSIALMALGGLFLSYSTSADAPLDIRVALVIGNASYKHAPALANATNDAKAMAAVLRKLGFTVVDVVDGSKDQMNKAIAHMEGLLKSRQAVGMLYYAGHGLQLDWHNFMVPIDAKLEVASDVPKQTIDIENVIDVLKKSGTRMNIIVLDACRDNPFAEKASGKGLAQLDAPPGTYLAFATSPGNVAEDGDVSEGNGLFTQYLLKELQRPAKIEEVFKRVRLQVRQKSQGRQIPWDSSSLEDEFAFNDGGKFTFKPEDLIKEAQAAKDKVAKLRQEAEAAVQREKELTEQRRLEQQRLAEAQKIQETAARQKAEAETKERERQLAIAAEQERLKSVAAAQALEKARADEAQRLRDLEQAKLQASEELRRSKLSQEAAQEQQFTQEKVEWDKIKDSKNASDFYDFLFKYPNGPISRAAEGRLSTLSNTSVTPSVGKNDIQPSVTSTNRFKIGDTYSFVTKDPITNIQISRGSHTVVKIDDYDVYLSDGAIYTRNGAAKKIKLGRQHLTYNPPQVFYPPEDFKIGDKWQTWSKVQIGFIDITMNAVIKVDAIEDITVEAGNYRTYRISAKIKNFRETVDMIAWLHPDFGIPIKYIFKSSRGTHYSWEITKKPRE